MHAKDPHHTAIRPKLLTPLRRSATMLQSPPMLQGPKLVAVPSASTAAKPRPGTSRTTPESSGAEPPQS